MSSLYDLPDEILLEVVCRFEVVRSFETQSEAFRYANAEKGRQRENHIRQQALYALCVTSRRLRYLSLPSLYSSSVTCASRRGHRSLQLLHRTIIEPGNALGQTKRLAEHVRYIENRLADYRGDSLQADVWFQNGPLASYFQLLADLILRAPNLEHICVVSVEHNDVSLWNHIYDGSPSSSQQILLKLKHLSAQVHTYPYSSVPGVSQLERMLQHLRSLPVLSDLRISGATASGDPILASPVDKFSNLRRLDLAECNLAMVEVAKLLWVCTRLQRFTCVWQFIWESEEGPSVLLPALISCSDTLETLALDWRPVRHSLLTFFGTRMIGSLKSLKNLRSLEICELGFLSDDHSYMDLPEQDPVLAMTDLLPVGLEELKLLYKGKTSDYESNVLENASCLRQFGSDCKIAMPHLKTLCIKAEQPMALPTLTDAFARAGVQLRTEVEHRR